MRPCSLIAKAAADAPSPVTLRSGEATADASSMFDLMALGLEGGSEIVVSGQRCCRQIVDAIANLFESNFAGDEPS